MFIVGNAFLLFVKKENGLMYKNNLLRFWCFLPNIKLFYKMDECRSHFLVGGSAWVPIFAIGRILRVEFQIMDFGIAHFVSLFCYRLHIILNSSPVFGTSRIPVGHHTAYCTY